MIESFNWNNSVELEDGTCLPEDCNDRAKYAHFLTNFLATQVGADGYVLNLNASWGAGKTYFLKRWAHELKSKYPVVYIDAWEQDYSKDPMLTVMSSVIEQLNSLLPDVNENINNISRDIARFLKAAAPAVTKGIVKKISGINIDEVQDNASKTSSESAFDGSAAAEITKALILDHNEKRQSIASLRKEIYNLVEAVKAHNPEFSLPAFIFIDELDRCRPNYAVEMLEVIKHFFSVQGVVFVIATDSAQLQYTIKSIYGEGFDANTYLGRFFKRRFTLNKISRFDFVRYKVSELSIPNITLDTRGFPTLRSGSCVDLIISDVANAFNLSLRDTEQLIDKFCSVIVNDQNGLNLYALAVLFVLHEKNIDLYEKCLSSVTLESELSDALSLALGKNISMARIHFKASEGASTQGIEPIWTKDHRYDDVGSFFTIVDLMCKFNKYLYLNIDQRHDETRNLGIDMRNIESFNFQQRMEYLAFWHMSRIRSDAQIYKNWIELAVSFNE